MLLVIGVVLAFLGMTSMYDGWEGSLLWKVEVTPGTAVTADTAFGVVKNINLDNSAEVTAETGVGTYKPVSLEEGIQQVGGSCEYLPSTTTAMLMGVRSSGQLSSYTIHGGAGLGINQVGSMINMLKFTIEPGGRLRINLDWLSLGGIDAAIIAPVVPTGELFNWIKCTQNLSSEVSMLEIQVNHNVTRKAVIANSGTTIPVTAQKRTPYKLKPGIQKVTATTRFFARPTETVVGDILTELATTTLACVGVVGGMPVTFNINLLNGKPTRRQFEASADADAGWPVELEYKDWSIT